jgi:hypothetical protein
MPGSQVNPDKLSHLGRRADIAALRGKLRTAREAT